MPDKYQSPRGNNVGNGKKNPFVDELGAQKESDSDSVQDSFTDTGSGWIPMMASNKKRMKFSLWDNMEVPGYSDRANGFGSPWNGMGEPAPLRHDETKNYENIDEINNEFSWLNRFRDRDNKEDDGTLQPVKNLDASRIKRIQKLSAIDDSWMQECANQIQSISVEFNNILAKKYGARWFLKHLIKDGNTLRLKWISNGDRSFLLYVRYNMGSDTYSASSSMYNSKTNEETTLHPWTDDVYVDTLTDPILWV